MNKAATNKEVRINNQKRIVNTLFHYGPMTKQELAGRLGLSLPTISVINKDLAAKGLIARGEKLESSGGRPASYIRLVFDARQSIGLDISPSHVRLALVNLGPKVICSRKHRAAYTETSNYWEAVREMLTDFISENRVDETRLLGIGISVQSPLKSMQAIKTAIRPAYMTNADLEKIGSLLGDRIEIHIEAKMASLAQVWGAGEENDVVYLMLSSGVGGAIIIDHNVLRKDSRNAEFGHMVVKDNGRRCHCGQNGCLGAYCSSRALQERAGMDLETFFSNLAAGNEICLEIWEEYLDCLALAVNNIHLIFDTDVIIGGEMSPFISNYLSKLRERVGSRNPFSGSGDYVRIGSYGEYDSAIGAALVHIDKFLS